MEDLTSGFHAFARQLTAQIEAAGTPQHENAIHHCVALGFQAAYDLTPGSIVFERPLGPGKCDLWMRPWDLAAEVKYFRPIPSGQSRPMPQHLGTLLADFNKLTQMPVAARIALLVADPEAARYVANHNHGLLPLAIGSSATITSQDLCRLSATASTKAGSKGEWRDLTISLLWTATILGQLSCFAWEVGPVE